jgi:hypothetical protein
LSATLTTIVHGIWRLAAARLTQESATIDQALATQTPSTNRALLRRPLNQRPSSAHAKIREKHLKIIFLGDLQKKEKPIIFLFEGGHSALPGNLRG